MSCAVREYIADSTWYLADELFTPYSCLSYFNLTVFAGFAVDCNNKMFRLKGVGLKFEFISGLGMRLEYDWDKSKNEYYIFSDTLIKWDDV